MNEDFQASELNNAIDAMFASEDTLAAALESDSVVLRLAARLALAPQPQLALESKQSIWRKLRRVRAAKILVELPPLDFNDEKKNRISEKIRALRAASALEQASPPNLADERKILIERQVFAAQELIAAPQPQLSATAKARIWARVQPPVLAAEKTIASKPKRPVLKPMFKVWQVAAALLLLIFFSGLILSLSAAASLPGDGLYPIKRQAEKTILALVNRDPSDRYLAEANARLHEAETLLKRGQYHRQTLDEVLNSLEAALASDSSPATQAKAQVAYARFNKVVMDLETNQLLTSAESAYLQMSLLEHVLVVNLAAPSIVQNPSPTATNQPVMPTATASPEPLEEFISAEVTISPEETELVEERMAYIDAGARVNVRSGPGQNFRVITQLEPHTFVALLRASNDKAWLQIRYDAEGRTGWIAAFLLKEYLPNENEPNLPVIGEVDTSSHAPSSTGSSDNNADTGAKSDENKHGCDESGNSCNAPGQTGATGNENPNAGQGGGQSNDGSGGGGNGAADDGEDEQKGRQGEGGRP